MSVFHSPLILHLSSPGWALSRENKRQWVARGISVLCACRTASDSKAGYPLTTRMLLFFRTHRSPAPWNVRRDLLMDTACTHSPRLFIKNYLDCDKLHLIESSVRYFMFIKKQDSSLFIIKVFFLINCLIKYSC